MTNLLMMMPRPASDIVLHVVEQSIHAVQFALNRSAIPCMFRRVNVLCYLQQLIGFSVRSSVAGVVRVIVVKVQ